MTSKFLNRTLGIINPEGMSEETERDIREYYRHVDYCLNESFRVCKIDLQKAVTKRVIKCTVP